MTEISGYNVKGLTHFVDWYHQLLEEPLLKWICESNQFEGCVFCF